LVECCGSATNLQSKLPKIVIATAALQARRRYAAVGPTNCLQESGGKALLLFLSEFGLEGGLSNAQGSKH
jgi:hypothetical protein